MRNKLGLCKYKLLDVEKKIVNLKLNLLDEYFMFNKEKFDYQFLVSLNNFLFSDIYYEEELCGRIIIQEEIDRINFCLDEIINICVSDTKDYNKIFELVDEIWNLQPFKDGNRRILIGFLKIISLVYSLDINIDVNKEISSNINLLDEKRNVNQKRLTKKQ